ncbi:MAG: helix-turn-helix domain-containing protein [Ruthenibacterium lactatiformans]
MYVLSLERGRCCVYEIKEQREAYGLTQVEIAKKAGISAGISDL